MIGRSVTRSRSADPARLCAYPRVSSPNPDAGGYEAALPRSGNGDLSTGKTATWKFGRWLILFLGLIGIVQILILIGLLFARPDLCLDIPVDKADVIIVLGGEIAPRIDRALRLFTNGVAPKILFSDSDPSTEGRNAINARIPKGALRWEAKSKSTKENAEFSAAILRSNHMHRAVIVTSWYHSRRALSAFHHFAPELEFYSMPTYYGIQERKTPPLSQSPDIFKEYLKTVGYFFWHGIKPAGKP